MDAVALLTLIGSGLTMVDEFYDAEMRAKGAKVGDHSVQVNARGQTLIVSDHGYEQEIAASRLQLAEFDRLRHDALLARLRSNWGKYNELDVERSSATEPRKAGIGRELASLRDELCPDFRELVRIYESVLQRSLPDHYTLYEVCG